MPEVTMPEDIIESEIVDGEVADELEKDPFEGRVLTALEAEAELQARVAEQAAVADPEVKPDAPVVSTEKNLAADTPAPVVAQTEGIEGAPVVPAEAAATPIAPPLEKKPFGFRVDGAAVEVPDAYVGDDGEIRGLTEEKFHKHIRSRYLGDRAAWDRQKAQYDRQIQALADENRPEIQRAKAIVDRFVTLLDMDDDARDEEIFKLKRELPVVLAQADAEAAKLEADAYRGEVQRTHQVEQTKQALPVLYDGLTEYVRNAVAHEAIKDAGLDAEEMTQALLKQFGVGGLYQVAKGGPVRTAAGEFDWITPRIDEFLIHNANLVRRERKATTTAEARIAELEARAQAAEAAALVTKRNAAVLTKDAPNAPPPVVPVSGGPTGDNSVKPWQDKTKTREEQKALFDAHMRKKYGISL